MTKGVNLPNVSLVINADLPVNLEHQADTSVYLQRIGFYLNNKLN